MSAARQRWIYFFGEPLPDGLDARAMLGGKGAALAEMIRAGWPVPPGFTITTEACAYFFAHDAQWPEGMADELRENLRRLETSAGRKFGAGPEPLLVSVRSGAALSMPGMMDTVLNCGRSADPWAELTSCINQVFRSWQSDRALAYRRRHGITGLAGTAVNVQAMFPSQVSGVLFTRDPAAPDAERMILEAAPGLGEAVVSGAVTPDRFMVERASLVLSETVRGSTGAQACLNAEQIRALGELALRVEQQYGLPQDIEWAWAEGRFALLQCRPIKGIELARAAETLRQAEIARLRELARGQRRIWVAHNLGETLPLPTPLTWDIIRHFMSGDGGFGQLYRRLGYQPAEALREAGFLELIAGRIYADPARLAGLFWSGLPLAYDLALVAKDNSALNHPPTQFVAEQADGALLWRLPTLLAGLWRGTKTLRRLRTGAQVRFEQQALPPFLEFIKARRAMELASLSVPQLLAELAERRRVLDEFGCESLLPGFFGGLAASELEALLARLLGPGQAAPLMAELTAALPDNTTVAQSRLLERAARDEARLEEFLEAYGHRCPGEMELSQPRWREDAAALHAFLRPLAGDAQPRGESNVFQTAWAQLPETLTCAGASAWQAEVGALVAEARALLPFREIGKHYLMMVYELLRQGLLELGRRAGCGEEVFYLRLAELQQMPAEEPAAWATTLKVAMARRKSERLAAARLPWAELIDSTQLEELGRPAKLAVTDALQGTPVSAGVASGSAQIVLDPAEAGDLGADYILVCPSTDPGWTPLFVGARGLIVERGGLLSHGAIVARDFGLPAVVLPGATALFRNGEYLRLDGHTGQVRREAVKEAGA